jgi:hypothetical protein
MMSKSWAMLVIGSWLLGAVLAHGAGEEPALPPMAMVDDAEMACCPSPGCCGPLLCGHPLGRWLTCHPLSELGRLCCGARACGQHARECCRECGQHAKECCHNAGQWLTYCPIERGCGVCCHQPDPCAAPPVYLYFLTPGSCQGSGGRGYAVAPYQIDESCFKPKCKEIAVHCAHGAAETCHRLADKCEQAKDRILHRDRGLCCCPDMPACYPSMPMDGEYWGAGLPNPAPDQ